MSPPRRLKIFTWHIHGSYLYYLSQGAYDLYIPVTRTGGEGYYGRGSTFPFGPNVIEIPAEDVKEQTFDCILYQTKKNYLQDQYDILSEEQQAGARIFLQHDPPWEHPTNSRHVVNDAGIVLVHVTHFNSLMWDNGQSAVHVIEHGIKAREIPWKGDLERGLVMVNNFADRGRMLGLDIFQKMREKIPLDLIGMDSVRLGGLGEVLHPQLPEFLSHYRFFFNPIRYTSLGLSVLEAMHLGLPVVGLATTEMVTTLQDGVTGFIHTDVVYLEKKMRDLLGSAETARVIGQAGKLCATQRFGIERFITDWTLLFTKVAEFYSINPAAALDDHLNTAIKK